MRNFYYLVWSDAIISFKKHNPNNGNWQLALLIYLTWINALKCWIVLIWLKYFKILEVPLLELDVFPGDLLNRFFAFSIEFALPFGLINYSLIFRNERHKKILEKYNPGQVRYAQIYSYTIALSALLTAISYSLLS